MKLTPMVILPLPSGREAEIHELILCEDCFYWNFGCCTKYGKQEHPARFAEDFCSRGTRREEE